MKFITYTVGLDCNGHGNIGKLAKVEISRADDGKICLQAVSGHNLAAYKAARSYVTEAEYQERSGGHNIDLARWALAKTGFTLMADDAE